MTSDGFIIRSLDFQKDDDSQLVTLEVNDEAIYSGSEVQSGDYVLSLAVEGVGAVYFNDYEARQLLEAVSEVVNRHSVREVESGS